jgi:hypothetical protein
MTDLETLITLLKKFDMSYVKRREDDRIKVIITKNITFYFDNQGDFIEWFGGY